MNNIILLLLALAPFTLYAQDDIGGTPAITTGEYRPPKVYNPHASHWIAIAGFEGLEYEVPFEFDGTKEDFSPYKQKLYGGRIGFGREFYLGAGFSTTTMLEGFYVGTLFEEAVNAAPEETSVEFAFTKRTGHIYGGELIQSLGYIFDMKTKNPFMDEMTYLIIQPFIEGGIGTSRGYNRLHFKYDTTGSASGGVLESYKNRVEDNIVSSRLGIGVNIASTAGYFLYLKASQHRYDVIKRTEFGFRQAHGDIQRPIDVKSKDTDMDPIMVYSLGGGYKF